MSIRLRALALSVGAAVLDPLAATPALADLLVAPTRVVLSGSERSAELMVMNKGTETEAFRIALENRRMKRDGSFEEVASPQPGEHFADDIVRYSPRRVILEPNARQTIVVSAGDVSGLEPGEYRSHLHIMSAPTSAGRTLTDVKTPDDKTISIQLIAIRSVTIPVIVRVGKLEATVEIEGGKLAAAEAKPDNQLVLTMTRKGDRSVYGDITFSVDGEATPVYSVRGVSIYTPNTEREVQLVIPPEVRAKLAGHAVKVAYTSADATYPGLIAAKIIQF